MMPMLQGAENFLGDAEKRVEVEKVIVSLVPPNTILAKICAAIDSVGQAEGI